MCDDIAATSGKLGTLTDRERETTRLIANCKSPKQVAVHLGISIKTAETPRATVFSTLQGHPVAARAGAAPGSGRARC